MRIISEIVQDVLGADAVPEGVRPVYGGDINEACLVVLKDGRRIFMKVNTEKNAGFFKAEQTGLAAIRKTECIRVPEVLSAGISNGRAYLMMEYLDAAPKKKDYWERFGRQLAAMHRADTKEWTPGGKFGFTENNYIGAGAQENPVCDSWVSFFREYRLEIQFRRALHYFNAHDRRTMQRLLDHLDDYLLEPDHPSLLHGDLWSGNFVTGPDGHAWLIDPAAYVGHAEADIAMTELFGGFAPAFYDAYRKENPFPPGYEERRELYNLYHLLNHLNLFGSSYYGSVMRIVKGFTGQI